MNTPLRQPDEPGAAPLALPDELAATLVLVRHGQSVDLAEGRFQGRRQMPLSPLGEREAALAGARLADPDAPPRLPVPARPPLAIVHSPLRRAAQTAQAVSAAFEAAGRPAPPLRPDGGLAEIAQGEWEGLPQAEVEARYPDLIDGWRRNPAAVHAPGGEALPVVDGRVRATLARVIAELAEADRARPGVARRAVGAPAAGPAPSFYSPQAGPWTILVGHDGSFKIALLALLGLPLERFWSFTQAPAAIAIVDLRNGRAVLRAWNRTEHLAPLDAGRDARLAAGALAEREASGAL